MALRLAIRSVLVVLLISLANADHYNITLLVTRSVKGAVYRVDEGTYLQFQFDDTQCEKDADPCACKGGAARRQTILEQGRSDLNTVVVDSGSYFFGSALFFPTFEGNASRDIFAAAGYNAYGLAFREYTSYVSPKDPTGATLLANYLGGARARDPNLPRATATNLVLDDSDPLAPHVARHTLVPLADGRTLAFLALSDPTHVWPLNPYYASRMISYPGALLRELAVLRRLPDAERPDVVVAVVGEVPFAEEADGVCSNANAAGGRSAVREAFIEALVLQAVGLDIVLLSNSEGKPGEPYFLSNFAGDRVLVVPDTKSLGVVVDSITATFDDAAPGVVASARRKIELTCDVAEHAATSAAVEGYLTRMEARLGTTIGFLAAAANGDRIAASNATESVSVPAEADVATAGRYAGCRVSECTAGNLIADAFRYIGPSRFCGTLFQIERALHSYGPEDPRPDPHFC